MYVALADRRGHAYNEETFQYLLALERKRAERSGRPFLLLLVDLGPGPAEGVGLDRIVARRLFPALWRCLRETDVVGWYREPRVAGAVLTDLGDGHAADVGRLMSERISGVLDDVLPSEIARRLQVRVYQHCELLAGDM
jgi:hypothetical protein